MSERMTSVHLRGGLSNGIADYGRVEPGEMIARVRRHAERRMAEAREILEAPDEDFHVATYVGPFAMKRYEVLQEGRSAPESRG